MAINPRRKTAANVRSAAKKLADAFGVDAPDLEQLAELGFTKMEEAYAPRLIIASSARDKKGKTHFAIHTPPCPLAILDTDLGLEGVVSKRPKDRLPYIHKKFPRKRERELAGEIYTQKDAEEDWKEVVDCHRAIVTSSVIRTGVADTSTELWEMVRMAKLGKLTQVKPHHYGPVNSAMRTFIQLPYQREGLNYIYIHKEKKEYKNDNWSGKYEVQGFSDTPFLVQCNINHFKTKATEDDEAEFGIRVINCRQNADMDGEELVGMMCDFPTLASMVFEETNEDDWK